MNFIPEATYFKPAGIPMRFLEEINLSLDEIEALRLADFQNESQIDAAKKMNISQSTFQRVLSSARQKVAEALVIGKSIKIQGGEVSMPNVSGPTGAGRGRQGGEFSAGPGGKCVCTNPECQHEISHKASVPCYQIKCPKCKGPMIRKVE